MFRFLAFWLFSPSPLTFWLELKMLWVAQKCGQSCHWSHLWELQVFPVQKWSQVAAALVLCLLMFAYPAGNKCRYGVWNGSSRLSCYSRTFCSSVCIVGYTMLATLNHSFTSCVSTQLIHRAPASRLAVAHFYYNRLLRLPGALINIIWSCLLGIYASDRAVVHSAHYCFMHW